MNTLTRSTFAASRRAVLRGSTRPFACRYLATPSKVEGTTSSRATESTNPDAAPVNSVSPKLSQDYRHTGLSAIETPNLFSLSKRGIIVTGGGRGLGLMVATAAIQSGCPLVYCLDIADSPDTAEWPAAKQIAERLGAKLEYRRVDVTDEETVDKVIRCIYEESDVEIGGYFGSAGMIHQIPAMDYPGESFRRVLDVNTTGSFLTMRATAREMINRGIKGNFALVASMSGTIANKGIHAVAYNTSKAACLQLARSCAAEWGVHGLRVNTLSPGYIRTAMTDKLLKERPDLEQEWLGGGMLGRLSTPDEFRGPAVFLLSDASSFMTGADLIVDGGHTAY